MLDWLSENRNLLLRLLGTLVATLLIVLLIQQEGWGKIVEAVKRITPASFFSSADLAINFPDLYYCPLACIASVGRREDPFFSQRRTDAYGTLRE